jgi:NAD(P)-dependent dehydrogenase (short-subunit alcohol dehydrogenase family)
MAYDPLAAFRMDGHAAIVTGGAQNIGAGIARAFAGAGAKVMIADLHGDKAAATASAIAAETGQDVRGMACDVTKEGDIRATVEAAVAAFGGLSTLVNNVGWGGVNPDPLAVTEQQMLDSYRLNTISAYRMTAACVPHLEKARNGAVINSGSFSSAVPAYDILAYATAKAALNQLMVSLAHALAKKLRVNSVLIGTVITEGYASAGIDEATQQRMMHPDTLTGRPGTPEDVANAMLWLASPAGSWVSGQTINVHGGGSVMRLFGH